MTWVHPTFLFLIPVALVAVWQLFHRASTGGWVSLPNIHRLWADRHGVCLQPTASRRRLFQGVCLAAGSAAALLALARPQWGEIAEPRYERSREVMLALDLSRSMLADDVAPNRLARAKLLIDSLLDQLKGERVGLIVFSGTAFVQSPLSADYEVLRDLLGELDPSYLPEGGTDYESMLRAAAQGFGQEGDGDRYLVVLSDGEALDEHWQALVPALRERGIHVIGLGIGTPAGALVPDGHGGLVKDERGAAVLSRLEPRTLQELASATDGQYRDAATWVDVAALIDATVEQGRRGHYVEAQTVRLQDRYQWFLAAALLFLFVSYWLEFPLSPLARALPKRGRRSHPASAPALAAAFLGLAAWHTPRPASAAVSDPPPLQSGTASQPSQLTTTVADLSARSALSAADYARLASDTIQFAAQPSTAGAAGRSGIVGDGLAAVDRGEHIDPRAADWPTLRRQLEALKQIPPPPPQQDKRAEKSPKQSTSGDAGQQKTDSDQNRPQSGRDSAQHEQTSPSTAADGARGGSDESAPDHEPRQPAPDGGGDAHENRDADSQNRGADGKNGEVPPAERVQPLDSATAGLGGTDHQSRSDQEEHKDARDAAPEHSAAEPTPAEPNAGSRMVGGGRAMAAVQPQGAPELAVALDEMQRLKEGD